MSNHNYGKGSIGTSMTLIRVRNGREIKAKPPRRSDCRRCVYAIINGECITCYITQEVAVNKQYCYYYRTVDEPVKQEKQKKKKYKHNGRRGGAKHGKR